MSEKAKQAVNELAAQSAANELQAIFVEAKKLVEKNFTTEDNRDYNIKVLAVSNEMIELRKISKMK
jgi:hypothetical protein